MSNGRVVFRSKKPLALACGASLRVAILLLGTYFLCAGTVATATELNEDSEFIYDAQGKRNPFIPLVSADGRFINLEKEAKAKGDLAIEGISYDKNGRSYAIVNGLVVEIGDTVLGYQVLTINADKLIFIKDGVTTEVPLKKEEE